MEEKFLLDIAGKILLTLGSYAIKQFGLAWGFTEELTKIKDKVSTINNALLDAQEQQMSNRVVSNNAVKEWLQRLKVVLEDAGDLFDKVATETRRREVETRNSWVRKVRYFFKSSNPLVLPFFMGSKLKDIKKRIDEIVTDMHQFHFIVAQVGRPVDRTEIETYPSVNTRRIIGRDGDKEKLVSLLLSSGYEENVPIIPIVGIGGLGKTALAQLVYDDHRIKNHFTKRLWVCISIDFDIKRILLKILQADGDNWHSSFSKEGPQQLQTRVTKLLSDDKFLLFLDDVWNEDVVKWRKLEDLLIGGESTGSRIVVTTRSEKVAFIVKTRSIAPYKLRGLSNSECLTILVELAFKEGEEGNHEHLVNIGEEIVVKCGGVPLAAVTLGSLLFLKRDERDWLHVRNSEMRVLVQSEDDILPILKLSYDQMPRKLKNCFAYCSLFEKDEIIDGKKLVYAWMAQGFIQCLDGAKELEDIGEGYILELVRRSFLEPYDGRAMPGGREHYKMHNLVHDLAQYVAGNEYLTIKGALTTEIPDTVRHVSFDASTYSEFPRPLVEDKKLRTIFYPRKREPTFGSSVEIESESFRCLRLLEGCTFEDGISSLEKIGKLKLLRYLGFNGVGNLPKSLCKLLNLQYLDLSLSWAFEWPKDFGKLIDLRFLCLKTRLKRLPKNGFCRLTSLRTLIIFHCETLRSLDEGIEQLSCLRELAIEHCHKLVSLPAGLMVLTSLERLEINFCTGLNLSNDDDLKGLISLKKLKLGNLPTLVSLPKGLLDAAATLTHLEIEFCSDFTSPSESVLPKLLSLQSLIIWHCYKVGTLPKEMPSLTKLQNVRIVGCDTFRKNYEGGDQEWRKIEHVPKAKIEVR
ncbi:hypothetical protein RHGRI_006650 [Rhododendron griersonianum]|uniref:Uncharacterized protein n=1 Tax=Rhododendron griersonianum TaxID=479676 RepID=A0AAV6KVD0_9ERIC|nr:hypothetical protein RHGRI_006650 [Rhododendron griersonianum]